MLAAERRKLFVCEECGEEFAHYRRKSFCSGRCSQLSSDRHWSLLRGISLRKCVVCGDEFAPFPSGSKIDCRGTCSACYDKAELARDMGMPISKWLFCANCEEAYPVNLDVHDNNPGFCKLCIWRRLTKSKVRDETSTMIDWIERYNAFLDARLVDREAKRKAKYQKEQTSREAASFCSGMRRAMGD